jgi:hypothetical protein
MILYLPVEGTASVAVLLLTLQLGKRVVGGCLRRSIL